VPDCPKAVRQARATTIAVGTTQDLFVTIINRTHSTSHDVTDVLASIQANGFQVASSAYIVLSGGQPGDAASMNVTLGGAKITNDTPWLGEWKPLKRDNDGAVRVLVQSTTAVIVRLHAAGANSRPIQMDEQRRDEIVDSTARH
jgi:bacillopeptidase F (M6 metalloprotease family)